MAGFHLNIIVITPLVQKSEAVCSKQGREMWLLLKAFLPEAVGRGKD